MDIDIDDALVRQITSEEYALTRSAVTDTGTLAALTASQQRHDVRLAAAADAATLACKAGCFWCCYFTIDVRPVEVFRILDFVATRFSDDEQQRVRAEITANSAALAALDHTQRTRQNIKCPFLAAGRCTIYAARPQTCRNYHATNVAGCQQSFEEPDNDDIDPEFAPLVYQTGGAHVDAFSQAMSDAGYDTDAFEMNTALAAAMAQPDARERFESKGAAFVDLEGIAVPPEFMFEDEHD
jgi:Fe-S-cluster containining protein